MKSSDYWRQRFEILEHALDKIARENYENIAPVFDEIEIELDQRIEKWLYRIAKNNQLSMAEARKLLKDDQLKEFHWSVEEYIRYGRENAIDQQWMKELENASAKYHISQLEALKLQTRQSIERTFHLYQESVMDMTQKVYTEEYYRSVFEIQKGLGIGWNVSVPDEEKLRRLITKPWAADGKNFSDRIWTAKSQMVDTLHKQLVRTCILGESPDKAIKEMTKYVKKGVKNAKAQAGRLIMTEQAFFSSAAQKDAFRELGVEEYEIVATLDSHTSEICQEMDGKHFPMSQYEPGVTAPPFHVWCRSTTCPYFDDEFTAGEMRAARDEEGKTYYVPADMKYSEWEYKTIVEPEEKGYNIFKIGVLEMLKDFSTDMNQGAQSKHIRGSHNFDEMRSELTADPQELYDLYSTKGRFLDRRGEWNNRELFVHEDIIGIYRNKNNGKEVETNAGIIHYSKKKGWHIVPANLRKKNLK